MTQDEIVTAARSCLGTPFRHQGRLVGVALDCAGLVVHVARTVGVESTDLVGYGPGPLNGALEAHMNAQECLERVSKSDMQSGDILLMRFTKEPQHLAICTGENMVHAYADVGRCVEHRIDNRWNSRIVMIYRFVGVTE